MNERMKQIKTDPLTSKQTYLVCTGFTVNFYSLVVTNSKGETKMLKKADSNDRNERRRPEQSEKSSGEEFKI